MQTASRCLHVVAHLPPVDGLRLSCVSVPFRLALAQLEFCIDTYLCLVSTHSAGTRWGGEHQMVRLGRRNPCKHLAKSKSACDFISHSHAKTADDTSILNCLRYYSEEIEKRHLRRSWHYIPVWQGVMLQKRLSCQAWALLCQPFDCLDDLRSSSYRRSLRPSSMDHACLIHAYAPNLKLHFIVQLHR